jgi:hypothetical protein
MVDKICLPVKVVPLLDQFIGYMLFKVAGGLILQSENYEVFFEEVMLPDIPTPSELAEVLPDSSNSHQLSINTDFFKEALKYFKIKDGWRWGQVWFNYDSDGELNLSWSTPRETHCDSIPVTNEGATDHGDFCLPTKIIKTLLPLFEDFFTLTYNSGNPRDTHQQTVLIESGHLKLVLVKLIVMK